ncbi:MAG: PAS domain S-box protein [Anaerolineales bacterium]|nr:PAS domain S-box protein [Anaerolineales bacterium]
MSKAKSTSHIGDKATKAALRASEEALRQSEYRYRQLAERSTDFIWIADDQGHFTYASPSYERISGYSPERLIGSQIGTYAVPEVQGSINEIVRRYLNTAAAHGAQTTEGDRGRRRLHNISPATAGYGGQKPIRLRSMMRKATSPASPAFPLILLNASGWKLPLASEQRLQAATEVVARGFGHGIITLMSWPGMTGCAQSTVSRQICPSRLPRGCV